MARVTVIRGGRSLEREISLRSGHHVASALRHDGHDVTEVDVDERLTSSVAGADAAFIALHGRDGEDGTIQSILEALGVPYTGSGPLACHLCFDKAVAKGLLARAGIATPDAYVISAEAVRRMGAGTAVREGAARIGFPIVVKPAAQGSALGLAVVRSPDELSSAVMAAFNYGDRILLERFIGGREVAVGLLADESGSLRALPPVEIRTSSGVFDFQARVTPGGHEYFCPATLPAADLEASSKVAVEAASAFGLRDFARADLIVSEDGPIVLELNPCPGLTETSLVPLAASEAGYTFERFAATVLSYALARTAAIKA